nr:putative gastrointestinal growth factor xP4 [Anolis sagrei ordinatus]XP_060626265.1 putative gastrointestinal growth factor xP4 [Anolis sagrei ordinatus]XP_060626266.1 putative gastrointestinal growth factor xP4 [Anolis sagrei ordinatus]
MEFKTYWLLFAALCLTLVCSQSKDHPPYACQCLMNAKERKNCDSASAGITAEECTASGCCFDSTVPDVPWCFKPSGERVSLSYAKKMIKPEARMQCGYEGISRKRCKRIGCCFDPTVSGASMCFHPPVNSVSQQCLMDISAREECGYPGITAEECQEKGCCFNSYVVSTRWCFRPLSDQGHARMCGMAPKKRVQCGYAGISADECLGKGCCYEHYQYAPKVPWCFEPSEKQGNFSVRMEMDNF